MVCGGCCTSGDKGVGAPLLERALVFLDVEILGGIEDALLTYLPKVGLGFSSSANLLLQILVRGQRWG